MRSHLVRGLQPASPILWRGRPFPDVVAPGGGTDMSGSGTILNCDDAPMEGSPRMIPRLALIILAALLVAAGGWDGNYSGRLTLVGEGAMTCSKAAPCR
jgi:hypothetical protein